MIAIENFLPETRSQIVKEESHKPTVHLSIVVVIDIKRKKELDYTGIANQSAIMTKVKMGIPTTTSSRPPKAKACL